LVRKNLMDIVTLSGIRKELLLYLDEGPRNLSEIRERFDITSPEVSPRIKELMEHNLVKFEGKKYYITPMGKTIINKFKPFIDTIDFFDQYRDCWSEHDLSSIPEEMLYRIGEIKNYMIMEDDDIDIDRTYAEIFNIVKNSKYIACVCCVFNENFPEISVNAVKNNIKVDIIVTEKIYKNICLNYQNLLIEFIDNENAAFFVSKDNIKVSFAVSDYCLYFSLYYLNGKFDLHSNLISNDSSSIKWGNDLFEYYRLRAEKINKISIQ
jgi:predicted transcriptional regulator